MRGRSLASQTYEKIGHMTHPSFTRYAIAARSNTAHWTVAVAAVMLCSVLIGPRFALTVGTAEVGISQFVVAAGIGALAAIGALRVHLMRLVLFSIFVFGAIWSPLITQNFSILSFLSVLVIYGTYVFCVEADDRIHAGVLEWIHRCMAIISGLAVIQFVIQLVGLPYVDLSMFLSDDFTLSGYHTFYAIYPGHWLNKSNGFFLLEPSSLSQMSAIALMLELLGKRRAWQIALYCASLVVSFGGTGLMLTVFMAVPVFRQLPGKYKTLSLVGASALLLWYFNTDMGGSVLARVTEFSTRGTSASQRWSEPLEELASLSDRESSSIIFGDGPGNSLTELSPIVKVINEYGLLGTAPYLVFIFYCFLVDARSKTVSWALLFTHFFLAASFLKPHWLYFYYLVLMFVPARSRAPIAQRCAIRPVALKSESVNRWSSDPL